MRGDTALEVIRKLIFVAALVCLIVFGGGSGVDLAIDARNNDLQNDAAHEIGENGGIIYVPGQNPVYDDIKEEIPTIEDKFINVYATNPDTVGYVKVPKDDTRFNEYLVFQTTNNDFYLKHDANKKYSKFGSIFMDYRCDLTSKYPTNTVLYGHAFISGNYFSKIRKYWEGTSLAFYKTHPTIKFDTIYEEGTWKVFAAVVFNTKTSLGEVYNYNGINMFYTREQFESFITDIMDRSKILTDVDLRYGDKILTLSSCFYPYGESLDTRIAVFARKVRPGESAEVNVKAAKVNTNFYGWAWQVKNKKTKYGEGSSEKYVSPWNKSKYLLPPA
jgi:sortase B